ncbi:MAG: hypothetical protein QFB87_01625 [Patescibacteria group bacterium]|nr:hypothetical protein [Patescibacteria group bacterium]
MKHTTKKRSSSSRQQAVAKGRLTIIHHRHTGHLVHKRHSSYPVLAMLLLCIGVLISSSTHSALAVTLTDSASYVVTASLPGPAPATAATISAPTNNAHFKTATITVSGSCPLNTYVEISRNGVASGVALCSAAGDYSLQISLFNGANALQAQVYSQTDVPGPASPVVTVYFDPPLTTNPNPTGNPATTGSGATTPAGNAANTSPAVSNGTVSGAPAEPLVLKSQFRYLGHYTGQTTNYQFVVEGGTAPYALSIDWGDGTQKQITVTANGAFAVSHTYQKAGGYHGSYRIKATVVDGAGNQAILQLLAIINDPPTVPFPGSTGSTGGGTYTDTIGQYIQGLLKYIWPTYGVTVLMLASFWLGEWRELKILRPRTRRIRHV